ncbi:hypothetical protein CDAR_463151 [Caerostris darwini]|uniref:Uncharacterized protein n=1 Tax=Caerostris darwini TaxID=1538125 RepID=A0AAV4Q659_9ARAC|nr:hypothetical protein CDAR_463151 [Caerostris darwini]
MKQKRRGGGGGFFAVRLSDADLRSVSLEEQSVFQTIKKKGGGEECRVTSAAECVAMMDGLREFVNNLRSSPRSLLDAPTPVRSPPLPPAGLTPRRYSKRCFKNPSLS